MSETQTCPRREPLGMADPNSPFVGAGRDLDTWRELRPLGDGENVAPKDARSCSFCGSLHPDDFMTAIERGDVIGPTDKSYKAYVGVAYSVDDELAYRERVPAAVSEPAPAHDYAKFYYQHLSDEQRTRFIELVNAKAMTIGYPGHFYVLPFFARPVSAVSGDAS